MTEGLGVTLDEANSYGNQPATAKQFECMTQVSDKTSVILDRLSEFDLEPTQEHWIWRPILLVKVDADLVKEEHRVLTGRRRNGRNTAVRQDVFGYHCAGPCRHNVGNDWAVFKLTNGRFEAGGKLLNPRSEWRRWFLLRRLGRVQNPARTVGWLMHGDA